MAPNGGKLAANEGGHSPLFCPCFARVAIRASSSSQNVLPDKKEKSSTSRGFAAAATSLTSPKGASRSSGSLSTAGSHLTFYVSCAEGGREVSSQRDF